jgi:DNA-binding PadR family transcriptional regulator
LQEAGERGESPHGYELKQRLKMLAGHFRPVSDGALYPAIARLERNGWLTRREESGKAGANRHILSITEAGERELLNRLRDPSDVDISDRNRFFTLLAFLKVLQPREQRDVLQRRLDFLAGGRSFFQQAGEPVTSARETDPYRKGMLLIARETSKVERNWLQDRLQELDACMEQEQGQQP